ncbi:MAG TPA: hypothetical protein VFY14_13730 [Streptomyces sp.]|nr:hypothetical protein [Streptomyces sp.]
MSHTGAAGEVEDTNGRHPRLVFAGPGEAAELAAFLGRLLRWEKTAAVRLRAAGDGVLGVFARPARFEVLAVRTARLTEPLSLDVTVSAGELLENVDEASESVSVPAAVTGPPWAGLLPPRGGWRPVGELPYETVRATATAVVTEFRRRSEALPARERTREALDALAEEIWSRTLSGIGLPLRAVHAAQALGMLRPTGPEDGDRPAPPVAVLASGSWLRLRTPYGSTAVRRGGGTGLSVTPV